MQGLASSVVKKNSFPFSKKWNQKTIVESVKFLFL